MSYLGIDAEGAERRGMRKNDEEQVNTYAEENVLCSVTSEFYIIGVPTRIYITNQQKNVGSTSVSIFSLLHLHVRVESNIGV